MTNLFNLMTELLSWILKPEIIVEKKQNDNIDLAQREWNEMQPQKRWYSFINAIMIDIIPLLMAICFTIFCKSKSSSKYD